MEAAKIKHLFDIELAKQGAPIEISTGLMIDILRWDYQYKGRPALIGTVYNSSILCIWYITGEMAHCVHNLDGSIYSQEIDPENLKLRMKPIVIIDNQYLYVGDQIEFRNRDTNGGWVLQTLVPKSLSTPSPGTEIRIPKLEVKLNLRTVTQDSVLWYNAAIKPLGETPTPIWIQIKASDIRHRETRTHFDYIRSNQHTPENLCYVWEKPIERKEIWQVKVRDKNINRVYIHPGIFDNEDNAKNTFKLESFSNFEFLGAQHISTYLA